MTASKAMKKLKMFENRSASKYKSKPNWWYKRTCSVNVTASANTNHQLKLRINLMLVIV
jgi:hypothetical protein